MPDFRLRNERQRFWAALASVVVLAFALRVGLVFAVRSHHAFGYDASWYHAMANGLAAGNGYVVRCPLVPSCTPRATAYFPPGYPLALAAGARVGIHSLLGQQLLSACFGTVSVLLIGLLGRQLVDWKVGLLAAGIAAIHPCLFGADIALMSESLFVALVTAVLLLVYRFMDRPSVATASAVGVAAGAMVLTRTDGGVVLAIVVVAAAASLGASVGRRVALAAVVLLVAGLVLAPWLVRNTIAFDKPVLLSNNAAAAVAGANCATTYHGPRLGSWDFRCLHNERNTADVNAESRFHRMLLREGLRYEREHLRRVPLVAAVRLLRTWGLYAPRQQAHFEEDEGRHLPLQLAGVALEFILLPAALVGLVLLARSGTRIGPLVGVLVAVALTSIATYGNTRFRAAAEPVVIVAAANALVAGAARAGVRHTPRREHA